MSVRRELFDWVDHNMLQFGHQYEITDEAIKHTSAEGLTGLQEHYDNACALAIGKEILRLAARKEVYHNISYGNQVTEYTCWLLKGK